MTTLGLGKIGLALAADDTSAPWYQEAAEISGIPYDLLRPTDFDRLGSWRVVALCGSGSLTLTQKQGIRRWLEFGGRLVVSGGDWGLAEELGVTHSGSPNFSRSYVFPLAKSPLWPDPAARILFFGGPRMVDGTAKIVARGPSGEAALADNDRVLFLAPHLGRTLRTILMGRGVSSDGIGPGDGSCILEDDRLRAEDGSILDWVEDRENGAFIRPYADLLREMWVRLLMTAQDRAQQASITLSPWPNGFEAVAALSVDCDGGDYSESRRIARTLPKFGLRAGWMAPGAGLPQDLARALRAGEHSFGLLFSGHSEALTEDQVKLQMVSTSRLHGCLTLNTVRPSDGGWEGYDRFYDLAEKAGAKACLSKGGRQVGTSGFLFGSCRAFNPRRRGGQPRKILELPYVGCLPAIPDGAMLTVAGQVFASGGCLHVAIDVGQEDQKDLDRSLINLNMAIRQKRLLPLTPDQAVTYEAAMRGVEIQFSDQTVTVVSAMPIPGFTLLTPQGVEASLLSGELIRRPIQRYGRCRIAWSFDLHAKEPAVLRLDSEGSGV